MTTWAMRLPKSNVNIITNAARSILSHSGLSTTWTSYAYVCAAMGLNQSKGALDSTPLERHYVGEVVVRKLIFGQLIRVIRPAEIRKTTQATLDPTYQEAIYLGTTLDHA